MSVPIPDQRLLVSDQRPIDCFVSSLALLSAGGALGLVSLSVLAPGSHQAPSRFSPEDPIVAGASQDSFEASESAGLSIPQPDLASDVVDARDARARATGLIVKAVSDSSWILGPRGISEMDATLEAGDWGDRAERRGLVASLLVRHALAEPRLAAWIPAPWEGPMLDHGLSSEATPDWSRVAGLLRLLRVEEISARHQDSFLAAFRSNLVEETARELQARHAEALALSPAIGALAEEHAPRVLDECFDRLQSTGEQLAAAQELAAVVSPDESLDSLWGRHLESCSIGTHVAQLQRAPLAPCTHPSCARGYSPLHSRWIEASGALTTPGPGKWGCVRRLIEARQEDHPSLQADWIPRSSHGDWPDRLRAVCLEAPSDRKDAAACLPSLGFFSDGGAPVREFLSGAWPSDSSERLLSPESSGADWLRWVGELSVPKAQSPVALIVAIADRGELRRKDLGDFGSLAVQLPARPEAEVLFAAGAAGPVQPWFEGWSSSPDARAWSLGLGPALSTTDHDALLLALLCLDQIQVRASTGTKPLTRPLALAVVAGPGAGPVAADDSDDAGAVWSLAVRLTAQRLGCEPSDSTCIESALMKILGR